MPALYFQVTHGKECHASLIRWLQSRRNREIIVKGEDVICRVALPNRLKKNKTFIFLTWVAGVCHARSAGKTNDWNRGNLMVRPMSDVLCRALFFSDLQFTKPLMLPRSLPLSVCAPSLLLSECSRSVTFKLRLVSGNGISKGRLL